MLPKVDIGRHCCSQSTNLENYRPLVGDALIGEIRWIAAELSGVRLCHINSTVAGGGVAELLGRHIPLLQALTLSADWRLIHGDSSLPVEGTLVASGGLLVDTMIRAVFQGGNRDADPSSGLELAPRRG